MCAIFGFLDYGKKVSASTLKRLLMALSVAAESRGTDATGISYVNNGNIVTFKKAKPAHKVKLYFPKDTTAVIGHTRFTTQGSEKNNYNNHPFEGTTNNHTFALAHNGVLYNDKELRREKNLPDTAIETDSYIAVQLIEHENSVDSNSIKAMAEAVTGSFVFTILRDDNTLFLVKGDNPITLIHFPEYGLYVYTLTFKGYDEEPQMLDYTKDPPLTEYIDVLNGLLTNPAIMFALCCSCASLFLAFLSMVCGLPLMSFIVSFYGKSTTGKSTAQTLMASVYTDPKDKKVYIPFFGTLNAIIKNFSQKFGVPQLFDEATVASGLNMESLLYTITLEQDKSRCNSNADLRTPDTWKLIAITSSENRLLNDRHMHNRGLDARVLSFELAFTDNREHSDDIHDFCNKNYGMLGKALSEQLLCADQDAMIQKYDDCKENMRNAIDNAASFDLAERLINEYAVILLAGEVLVELGVNIDIDGITAIMAENCNSIREATDIAGKYYHHLVNYAVLHPYAEGIKKDEQTGSVAFIDELFLRVLSDYGASNPDLVIKELDAAGYLFKRKRNARKNRLRFGGTLVNCYEILLPKGDSGSDDGCMTLEYILTHFEGIDES